MRKGLMALAMLMLTSCVTVSDLEKREPEFSEHTAKTAEEYKRCVMQSWIDQRPNVNALDTDFGFKIVVPDPLDVIDEVLVIRRSTDGADVKLYERGSYLGGAKLKKTAKACL
jgi:hypothetical protein